jgi:hypothetical protein
MTAGTVLVSPSTEEPIPVDLPCVLAAKLDALAADRGVTVAELIGQAVGYLVDYDKSHRGDGNVSVTG